MPPQVIEGQSVPRLNARRDSDPPHRRRAGPDPGPVRPPFRKGIIAGCLAHLVLLAAPLTAQTVSSLPVRARVVEVGPSREALAAGGRALAVGRPRVNSRLATVVITPLASAPLAGGGLFRRRAGSTIRIDFLRN